MFLRNIINHEIVCEVFESTTIRDISRIQRQISRDSDKNEIVPHQSKNILCEYHLTVGVGKKKVTPHKFNRQFVTDKNDNRYLIRNFVFFSIYA